MIRRKFVPIVVVHHYLCVVKTTPDKHFGVWQSAVCGCGYSCGATKKETAISVLQMHINEANKKND